LEILIALLERPGELVSKQETMTRVWSSVLVEPANRCKAMREAFARRRNTSLLRREMPFSNGSAS
jgi:DNA-binding winged helix-turn-helix (wHTH) protein